MAVGAADTVDVVRAFGVGESGVHLFDVDAAVGHLRVAGFARGSCALVVAGVAGETTDAFVDAGRRAIVTGAGLRSPVACIGDGPGLRLAGRVALVAEGLALIGTDVDGARAFVELRQREQHRGKMQLLAAVVEGERLAHRRRCYGETRWRPGLRRTFAMQLVAGHARHGGLVGESRPFEMPRAGGVHWLNQVADRAVEVHAVAAKTVVSEAALSVVGGIGKYLRICGAVRTGLPRGELVLMTALALRSHGGHVDIAKTDCLRRLREEMHADVTQLGRHAGLVAIKAGCGAMHGAMDGAGVRGHLMTTGAALAVLRGVIVRRRVGERDGESRGGCEDKAGEFEKSHHERKAVPFQLRMSEAEA